MKKILICPFFNMPSGHHQVADALTEILELHYQQEVNIVKKDILQETSTMLEKVVSTFYLKWIRHLPNSYQLFYQTFFHSNKEISLLNKWFKQLFLKKMKTIVTNLQPDLIICTHGFPSFLLNELKKRGEIEVPIINAYTDLFVNSIWGKSHIDLHFVPNQEVKDMLMHQYCIPENKTAVTGIPINHTFTMKEQRKSSHKKVLVAGGSSGLGKIDALLQSAAHQTNVSFIILCGNNHKLYAQLNKRKQSNIIPLPYIHSRKEMDDLYNNVDAIITKPGGVTISEALRKRLMIFIHSTLPGQEQMNLTYLKKRGLVYTTDSNTPLIEQVLTVLNDEKAYTSYQKALDALEQEKDIQSIQDIVQYIDPLMAQPLYTGPRQKAKGRRYVSKRFIYSK